MTSPNGRALETIEGSVVAANDHGVKIGDDWWNVSKFGKPVELPGVGARVRLQVDGKGFIQSVEVLASAHTQTPDVVFAREKQIARLTVLKAAANFAATRTDIKSADVLAICDRWLAWVEG